VEDSQPDGAPQAQQEAKRPDASSSGETRTLFRSWTDITGEHTTEAQFVGLEKDSAILKTRDDTPVVVPLEQLSKADQE
jgi:hypothetical protein